MGEEKGWAVNSKLHRPCVETPVGVRLLGRGVPSPRQTLSQLAFIPSTACSRSPRGFVSQAREAGASPTCPGRATSRRSEPGSYLQIPLSLRGAEIIHSIFKQQFKAFTLLLRLISS